VPRGAHSPLGSFFAARLKWLRELATAFAFGGLGPPRGQESRAESHLLIAPHPPMARPRISSVSTNAGPLRACAQVPRYWALDRDEPAPRLGYRSYGLNGRCAMPLQAISKRRLPLQRAVRWPASSHRSRIRPHRLGASSEPCRLAGLPSAMLRRERSPIPHDPGLIRGRGRDRPLRTSQLPPKDPGRVGLSEVDALPRCCRFLPNRQGRASYRQSADRRLSPPRGGAISRREVEASEPTVDSPRADRRDLQLEPAS